MLLVLATSVEARLTEPAIEAVGASPPAGARVPLSVTLLDDTGIPQELQASLATRLRFSSSPTTPARRCVVRC